MRRADQELAQDTGKGEARNLGGENQQQTGDEGVVGVVKELLEDNDIDSVSGAGVDSSHGTDQDVLLDGEGAGVEREGPAKDVELAGGEDSGHEVAQGERDQGDDRVTDRDLGLTEVEELVDKGDNGGEEETKEPHSEGVAWD